MAKVVGRGLVAEQRATHRSVMKRKRIAVGTVRVAERENNKREAFVIHSLASRFPVQTLFA
jgi:hypothetical protein